MPEPTNIVICHYRVKPGEADALTDLQRKHDALLRRLDLVTDRRAVLYRGRDEQDRTFMYKIFEWQSPAALDAARQHPEVLMIWEQMDAHCEPRDGRPAMEFPHVERIEL